MRRVIIGTAELAAYVFVLFVSITGAIGGYGYGSLLSFIGNDETTRMVGALVGFFGGFLTASVAAALLFLLIDIAANTRRMARMLDTIERQ